MQTVERGGKFPADPARGPAPGLPSWKPAHKFSGSLREM